MKKLLITAAAVLASLNLFAQGTINFANNTSSLVYLDQVGGTRAPSGNAYNVGLYYAPDGTTDESMFIMVGAGAGMSTQVTAGGVFLGGTRTVPTATPGGFAMVQVRGWTTAYGASYETGLLGPAIPENKLGKSNILRIDTGDPTTTPPGSAASLTTVGNSLTAFALTPVPEPSAIALGILGAGTLLLLRRRK
jgi:hypothetical protein